MEIHPAFVSWFVLFHQNTVHIREGVFPNTSHLPGDPDLRLVRFDRELVVPNLLCHNRLRELANYGQLVAEILVEGFIVIR